MRHTARVSLAAVTAVLLVTTLGPSASTIASGPAHQPDRPGARLDLSPEFRDAGGAPAGLSAAGSRPRALAAADFDEDGIVDLVAGFAEGRRGRVALLRGDADALYPNEPAARRRRAADRRDPAEVAPFLATGTVFETPAPVDLLGAGDFDNDGRMDVLAAADGGRALHLMRGDGRGGFAAPVERTLPGRLVGMVTGEINQPDGLADFAVAVERREGSEILVYEHPEGAWRAEPESLVLEAAVTVLALGDLNGDFRPDLVAGTVQGVAIVSGRDRRLSLGSVARTGAAPALVERHRLGFTPVRVMTGRFGRTAGPALALLGDDGVLRVAGPGRLRSPDVVAPEVLGRGRPDDLVIGARLRGGGSDDLLALGDDSAPPGATPVAALPLRLGRDARESIVVLNAGGPSLLSIVQPALAGTIMVTNNMDLGPGSLRQAIMDANATPGTDTIAFDIQPAANLTIQVITPLPALADPVIIDATTQPGYAGVPLVALDGGALPPSTDGLVVRAGDSVVRGLVIHRFPGSGVVIDGAGHNLVEGNFIGLDLSGTLAVGNGDTGVLIRDSHLNTVGGTAAAARNVISGNMQRGVGILGPSSYEEEYVWPGPAAAICDLCTITLPIAVTDERVIEDVNVRVWLTHTFDGDLVLTLVAPDGTRVVMARNRGGSGDDYAGTLFDDGAAVPISFGVPPFSGSFAPEEALSVLNGTLQAGTWNLEIADTAGGDTGAVTFWSMTTESGSIFGNVVAGNLIGTDVTGMAGLGNTKGVVIDQSPANLVGGTAAGARNVIAGSAEQASGHGVDINGAPAMNAMQNRVQGNYIGTDITGLATLGNLGRGVEVAYADTCMVGGTAAGAGNLISGNGLGGVKVSSGAFYRIQGNRVGTDATGSAVLGQGGASGIILSYNTRHSVVGGDVAAARNLISGNGQGLVAEGLLNECCNAILGNYVGTDASGTQAVPNAYHGVLVDMPDVRIGGPAPGEGNLFSGNSTAGQAGLALWPRANNCTVQGNIIGLDRTGTVPLGNSRGLLINGGSYNRYGGTTPAEANIIAGNVSHGVWIFDALSNTLPAQAASSEPPKAIPDLATITMSLSTTTFTQDLLANLKVHVTLSHTYDSDLILTLVAPNGARVTLANRRGADGDDYLNTTFDDGAGTPVALGVAPFFGSYQPDEPLAALSGIATAGTWTLEVADVVGGDSGTLWGWWIEYDYYGTHNSNFQAQVIGNYIGTTPSGLTGVGNGGDGVFSDWSNSIQIGLPIPGAANVISGNAGRGIFLSSPYCAANVVQSNLIGLAPDGVTPMGNGGDGIAVSGPVGVIGGIGPLFGNWIAYNGGAGVSVAGAPNLRQTTIRANSIYGNGGLGIDLAPAGVTLNDAGDVDFGANLLQNFPAIGGVAPLQNGILITGSLAGTPNAKHTIDAYGNAQADPSGHGEGRTWLGSHSIVTDGIGNAAWSIFTTLASVGLVSATATDFAGNTSESSRLATSPQEASPSKDMTVTIGAGGSLDVTYTPACGATDHVIYRGTAGPGAIPAGGMSWTNATCGLGTSGTASFFPGDPPLGQVHYFVIAGQNGSVEGSYGQDSASAERPEATIAGPCDRPRFLGGGCF